jgi:hypothetical protein
MADQNPYAPPQSDLGDRKPAKVVLIVVIASTIALAVACIGIAETLKHPNRSVVGVSMTAIPAILSLVWARFPGTLTLRVFAVLSGIFFCVICMAACLMHLRRFGLFYPLGMLYPSSLALALGVNVVAMFAWKPPVTSTPTPRGSA